MALSVEQKIGTKPGFGWNIENEKLVELTVYFDTTADKNKPLEYFLKAVRTSVIANMKPQPESLVVAFVIK